MAKKQATDIREKSVEALRKDVQEARKMLMNFHLDNQMRKLKNTRSIFLKRKEIARMLTVMGESIFAQTVAKKKEVKNG